jgi:anhydro-N-acetylmuramic acid kinase
MSGTQLFAGVMTGNSMDAIDVAVLRLGESVTLGHAQEVIELVCFYSQPLDISMREALQSLLVPDHDELNRAALIGNSFADVIGRTVIEGLAAHGLKNSEISALGVHGQTLRHRPELGYSIQLNAPSRIAEMTGLTVVSDFRSRDIAAGGQGAPLVPAFHRAVFGSETAVVNIGGISNISWLGKKLIGYDTGPGNLLMDQWAQRHLGQAYDSEGKWAQSGVIHEALLMQLLSEPFFAKAAPRSTGRELFNLKWLERSLAKKEFSQISAQDIQATLLALTARSIAQEIQKLQTQEGPCARVIVCGGGARNTALMHAIESALRDLLGQTLLVQTSHSHGWDPQVIEAAAFAWLAARTLLGQPGNAPEATGALGPRVLGSITPGAHRSTLPNA